MQHAPTRHQRNPAYLIRGANASIVSPLTDMRAQGQGGKEMQDRRSQKPAQWRLQRGTDDPLRMRANKPARQRMNHIAAKSCRSGQLPTAASTEPSGRRSARLTGRHTADAADPVDGARNPHVAPPTTETSGDRTPPGNSIDRLDHGLGIADRGHRCPARDAGHRCSAGSAA